jgi:radical SAM superfamily enzyme YgiQ (UPF0313 family)
MKVLLIQPPVRDFYQTPIRTQPIGLAYLAASLEQNNFVVEILDCQVTTQKKTIPLPEAFSHIKEFYPRGDLSPFRLFGEYYHFGLSYEEVSERIKRSNADAIGISSQFTPYCTEALTVASLVKSINQELPVIIGGAHVSAAPQDVLMHPCVDYIVRGEADHTLPLLLQQIRQDKPPDAIEGIGYKRNGTVHINPRRSFINELDSLPFPARHLLNFTRYTIKGKSYTVLITSRGCPQKCTYCSVSRVMGEKFRVRSPEKVLQEVKHCKEKYGISLFDIEDDNFTLDQKRALQILNLLIEEFGEYELQLYAMNGLSIFSLNKELIESMKRAGFHHLDLSLGSISPRASIQMNRPHNPQQATTVLKQAAEYNLPATTYIIFGIPGHTLEDMVQSLIYLMEQETLIGPSIFYPTPGTKVYEELYGRSSLPAPDYPALRSSLFPLETDEFSRLDLITLLKLSRWINFAKKFILPEIGKSAISLRELTEIAINRWLPEECRDLDQKVIPLNRQEPLTVIDAGKIMTALFLQKGELFGLKRLRLKKKEMHAYQILPHQTSNKVLQLFWNVVDCATLTSALKS